MQPWYTPFPIWNQFIVPCPVLTVTSWPAYRFLRRQVRSFGTPVSLRTFHSLLWFTQPKALVHSLSHVWLFATPWTAARQASLSITNSQSLLKLMSIESVMPSHHLILCHSLFLLPSIFPSIGVFSNELVLCIRWPKYWSFSISSSPSNIQYWFPLGLTGFISLQSKGLSRVFSNTIVRKSQFWWLQPWN